MRANPLAILLLMTAVPALRADVPQLPAPLERPIDFESDVRPLLETRCFDCHGAETQESGLRLDRRAGALRGGESGEPAIVAGNSAGSHLIRLVAGLDPMRKMPPDGDRLTAGEIALLRAWIDQGAGYSGQDDSEEESLTTDFWSFQPLEVRQPPVSSDEWISNPLDSYVLARFSEAGLEPSPPAGRAVFYRRLSLDMLGLLPDPDAVKAFVDDPKPDACERLVDSLLASPRYGERWARHWLDVVRFAETDGFEMNQERPNAWHYRDYVIRSLNEDKPYDRFVFEQLAGDALGIDAATGLLVGGPYDKVKSPDVALTLMQRQDELADIVNTTGTAFLGITLGCARCHNHKFDPVLQRDYYAWQAVFAGVRHGERPLPTTEEPAPRLRVPVTPTKNVERFSPVAAKRVRFTVLQTNSGTEPCIDELEIFSNDRNVALASAGGAPTASGSLPGHAIHKLEHINDGLHGNERSWISDMPGTGWVQIELPRAEVIDGIIWSRDRNGKYADRLPTHYFVEAAVEGGDWQRIAGSEDRMPQRPEGGESLVYAGTFEQPEPTRRLYRGDPMSPREVIPPDALAVLGSLKLTADAPEQQRRIALAEWIGSPDNPLTPRVIVNRLWQYHFGTGIVGTPSDFGRNGHRPTHPELLDWLAGELIRSGWSLKHIHRLILLSSAYRQSSAPSEKALAVDAGARLLWRFPPRRVEAEVVRDNILALSGALDPAMGGPGFSPFEPNQNYVRVYAPKETDGPADWRRMVYMHKVRMEQDAVFGAFDSPDAGQVCPQRGRSTTAIQALNLFNSQFVRQQAERFATRLRHEAGPMESGQIRRAFLLTFGREPDAAEAAAAAELVEKAGLGSLCRALFNANEFLFIP